MVERQDRTGPRTAQVAWTLDLTPYAGCWVAVVNGRVAAIGKTAQEALLAARYHYLKDEPALIWVPAVEK